MKSIHRSLFLLAAFLPAVFAPLAFSSTKNGPAPAWELQDLDGKLVKSSDFKGKVVILNFWATWCPPCREEIPGFIELQKQYGEKGLVVVGVSLDEGGPAAVKRFAERFKVNYTVVRGDEKILNDFGGINALPTTFVIDKEGRIVGKHIGYAEQSFFERAIKTLF